MDETTKVTICRTETLFRYVDIEIPYDKNFKIRACEVASMLPASEFENPTENILHRVVCWTAPSPNGS